MNCLWEKLNKNQRCNEADILGIQVKFAQKNQD